VNLARVAVMLYQRTDDQRENDDHNDALLSLGKDERVEPAFHFSA
jgi:hypothetical protein